MVKDLHKDGKTSLRALVDLIDDGDKTGAAPLGLGLLFQDPRVPLRFTLG
jgi:hypothetical protein